MDTAYNVEKELKTREKQLIQISFANKVMDLEIRSARTKYESDDFKSFG